MTVLGSQTLAAFQVSSPNECLAVFTPEGVAGRRADRFLQALDVQVDHVGGRVCERARDDLAGPSFEWGSRADVDHARRAGCSHFFKIEMDCRSQRGGVCGEPCAGTKQFDLQRKWGHPLSQLRTGDVIYRAGVWAM